MRQRYMTEWGQTWLFRQVSICLTWFCTKQNHVRDWENLILNKCWEKICKGELVLLVDVMKALTVHKNNKNLPRVISVSNATVPWRACSYSPRVSSHTQENSISEWNEGVPSLSSIQTHALDKDDLLLLAWKQHIKGKSNRPREWLWLECLESEIHTSISGNYKSSHEKQFRNPYHIITREPYPRHYKYPLRLCPHKYKLFDGVQQPHYCSNILDYIKSCQKQLYSNSSVSWRCYMS